MDERPWLEQYDEGEEINQMQLRALNSMRRVVGWPEIEGVMTVKEAKGFWGDIKRFFGGREAGVERTFEYQERPKGGSDQGVNFVYNAQSGTLERVR